MQLRILVLYSEKKRDTGALNNYLNEVMLYL